MLIRGKQGIEDVIPQTHRDHFGVIGLVLLQTEHLRSPGLRRNLVRRGMEQLVAGAVGQIRHPIHAVAHNAPVRGFWIAHLRQVRRLLIAFHMIALLHRIEQMRVLHLTVVQERGERFHHLDGGGDPVSLADTDGDGIPLVPGLFMHSLFPLPAGQHPAILLIEIDAGGLAVAEFAQPLMDPVDAHLEGNLVEKGVRRLFNGFGHVEHAVAGFQPVAVATLRARQGPRRRPEEGGVRRDHTGGERRQRHIGLHRRGRGIQPLGDAVDQRPVRVIQQRFIGLIADTFDERVRIIAGAGDHRQHPAIPGIDHHHRRALPLQYRLNILLQVQVKGQVEVFPGHRRYFFQQTHHPAVVVHFHLLVASGAVERFFVITLDPLLADIVVGSIVLLFAIFRQPLQVAVVDFRHIAHHVRQLCAVGVFTLLIALHRHPGETEFVDREAGHLHVAEVGFEGNRFIAAAVVHIVAEAGDVVRRQVDNRRQGLQQRGHIGNFARDHLQAIQGNILHQRYAVAIEYQPAAGGDGQHFNIVLVGTGLVEIVLLHLQMVEVENQHAKADHHQQKGDCGPADKQHLFRGVVANFISQKGH
ncbi:hypothetical protein KLQUCP357M_22120 [Klebsiella quasipneumoniae subsp. similipneumoniae]